MAKLRVPEVSITDLCDSIRASRKVLEPFRRSRLEAVRKYAGDQWSFETSYVRRPINFISLYLQIISRNLISHDPRALLTVHDKQYKSVVSAMQDWVNPELVAMGFADEMQRVVVDALYSIGIMKVALASPSESEMSGWNLPAGQPYACRIDLDDFVFDPHARDLREVSWIGHRSRVPLDSLKDSKLYEAAKRKFVQPNHDKQFNETGDERISMLGRQYVSNDFIEAYQYCDVWEIYLPRERMILCLLSEDGGTPMAIDFKGKDAPFYQKDWVGPDKGPYHILNLMPPVSGNPMPKGPIQDIIDMDEALNGLTQKLIDQAARQKELLAYSGMADSDAARIKDAPDGEVIRVDNVDKVKPMGFGGPSPINQQFSLALWEMLNKISGNLELTGGLAAQSRTASQDKMLNANSSRSVQDMQQVTIKYSADVTKSLCWFWHHHPQKTMTSYHPIPGLQNPIKRKVTPAQRQQVPFEAIGVELDPYSFQYQTPQDRMAFVNQTVSQIITPLMPLLQQQGVYFDVAKYLEMIGDYGNSPDLKDIINIGGAPAPQGPQDQGQDQGQDQPPMPGNTTRTYNRVNQSEATNQGQSKAMQQTLLGQNPGGRPSANGQYKPVGA